MKWFFHSIRNESIKFVLYRLFHSFCCYSGLMVWRFPSKEKKINLDLVDSWRTLSVSFFDFDFPVSCPDDLKVLSEKINNYRKGQFLYFYKTWYAPRDWHTHPVTGYSFEKHLHWSRIKDISEKGDIKFIWDRSRFTLVYDFIRYQHYSGDCQADDLFMLIEDWIKENPVNCGPNWVCSQEISIRIMNWLFALFYFKDSEVLTDYRLRIILQSIADQMHHVWQNRHFAQNLVRNNHVLTESLALYLTGLLLPFFPDSKQWKNGGKITFEQEIIRQIFEDGTYLQYSMNYHRMVVQLLSWYLQLSHVNHQIINNEVKNKAVQSVFFLRQCMEDTTGRLPNYGHNDGTLLYSLSTSDFTDYRPQLATLASILNIPLTGQSGPWDEEAMWITGKFPCYKPADPKFSKHNYYSFPDSGYCVVRDERTMTFFKCGKYRHRPGQADNMHLDLWVDGENILRDGGSYLYNTEPDVLNYFMGTASHNSVLLNGCSQMEKGPRFIWYDWIKEARTEIATDKENIIISAEFVGFRQLGKGISHHREVVKTDSQISWIVRDKIKNAPVDTQYQLNWHPMPGFFDKYSLVVYTNNGELLQPEFYNTYHSPYYGFKEEVQSIRYSTTCNAFVSVITEKQKIM